MSSLNLVTLFSSLTAAVAAVPTLPLVPAIGQWTLPQVSVGVTVLSYGPVAVVNDYLKHGVTPPQEVLAAAQAAVDSGSVEADPTAYDSQYLAQVTVGSTKLSMNFDTGSSDFWVFSTLQPQAQRQGHQVYKPSPQNKIANDTWSIRYGDGSSASGLVYADKVTIAGVTATRQFVEAATDAAQQFVNIRNNDGIVGLAFPKINSCTPKRCKTFMQNVGGQLKQNLFAAALQKGAPGSYDFGYIDKTKYSGKIAYETVNARSGFWQFQLQAVEFNGTTTKENSRTIVDTGTSLVYIEDAIVQNYYSLVRGSQYNANAGGWTFPCKASLPDISFEIGGVMQTVPGSYINYAPLTGSKQTCFGGLQSSTAIGFNILGDIFIKSKYVVFDVANTRIGVAQQK